MKKKDKNEATSKRTVYRPQHKILKDLKQKNTKHGFLYRIKNQNPRKASSEPSYCGVLGNGLSHSIKVDTTNYREAAQAIQEQLQHTAISSSILPSRFAKGNDLNTSHFAYPSSIDNYTSYTPPQSYMQYQRRFPDVLSENHLRAETLINNSKIVVDWNGNYFSETAFQEDPSPDWWFDSHHWQTLPWFCGCVADHSGGACSCTRMWYYLPTAEDHYLKFSAPFNKHLTMPTIPPPFYASSFTTNFDDSVAPDMEAQYLP